MFLVSETVSLSSFISFSIFSSFFSFTASGFASSDFIFSIWFAQMHVIHSKSMFIPNTWQCVVTKFGALCCQMHSTCTCYAIKILLSCFYITFASFACILGKNFGTCFSIEWPVVPKGTFGTLKILTVLLAWLIQMATVAVVCFAVDKFRVSCVVHFFFEFRIQNFFFD